MVLHLMPAPVQPELSNHLKFVYYILYIIWLMSCLPMTRDEWQSDWGVKKQDVSWQITSESLIDRLTCLTRWGMRMKMMTRRSQSIWRIDLIFITKKKTWNKKKTNFLAPECDRMYVGDLFVQDGLICIPQTSSTDIERSPPGEQTAKSCFDGQARYPSDDMWWHSTCHLSPFHHGVSLPGTRMGRIKFEQSPALESKKRSKISATYNYLLLIIY